MVKIRSSAIVLLMLWLTVLLVSADGVEQAAISLPSDVDGEGDEAADGVVSDVVGDRERPWKCCDQLRCTKSLPPICRCRDKVDQCGAACKRCRSAGTSSPGKHICMDLYEGWQATPKCTKHADIQATMEERPLACCTKTVCTRSFPPTCRCMDRVSECHPACQACHQISMGVDRYICQDSYKGHPGPVC